MSSGKSIHCGNCGAPVEYLEGEAVVCCAYCGAPNNLGTAGDIMKVSDHGLVRNTMNSLTLKEAAKKWMGEGFLKPSDLAEKAQFGEIKGRFLPFWVVQCKATTRWSGQRRHTRTVGSGKNQRTEEYWTPESGVFDRTHNWVVYARRGNEFGMDALNEGGKAAEADWGGFALGMFGDSASKEADFLSAREAFHMDKVDKALAITNGQITQEQAERQAENAIKKRHGDLAAGQIDRLQHWDTTLDFQGTQFVHFPLWEALYKYKNKDFKLLVSGGDGKILKGQYPVGSYDKAVVLTIFTGLIGGGAIVLGATDNIAMSTAAWIALALGALTGLYWVKAFINANKETMD